MVNQSKILTVSYGTFSCTLEGFDDPFNTMKAIAEYFRDLAADDRYFGAEPPTPDAAMLHKIAEREIHRRVEAKIQDNGVILRAGEAKVVSAPQPTPTYQAPILQAEALGPTVPVPQPAVPTSPQMPAPAPVAVAAPAHNPAALNESVAAKLARIRAAVDRGRASAMIAAVDNLDDADDMMPGAVRPINQSFAASVEAMDDFAAVEPSGADITPVVVVDLAPKDLGAMDRTLADLEQVSDPISSVAPDQIANLAERPTEDWIEEEAAQTSDAEPLDVWIEAPADLASKPLAGPGDAQDMDYVDDLPEMQPDAPVDLNALADDLPEDHAPEESEIDFAALMGALSAEQTPASDPKVALASEPYPAQDAAETSQALLAGMIDDTTASADVNIDLSGLTFPSDPAAETAANAEDTGDLPTAPDVTDHDGVMNELDLSPEDDLAPTDSADIGVDSIFADDGLDKVSAADVPFLQDEPAAPEESADPSEAASSAPVMPTRARVIKVRRVQRSVETAPEPVNEAPTNPTPFESGLSPEAEDDLSRELAALENEVAGGPLVEPPLVSAPPAMVRPMRPYIDRPAAQAVRTPVPEAPAAPEPIAREVPPADAVATDDNTAADRSLTGRRAALAQVSEGGDAAVTRLLKQTNAEMEGSDTRRRAATIAHLKAAVAATVAERLAPKTSDGTGSPDRADPYRDDLAQAVRPRRPLAVPSGNTVTQGARRAEGADRVPPLVLVSEQRIDVPSAPAPSPVRPRRVSSSALALEQEDDIEAVSTVMVTASFSDFAHRLGATVLPDLMEAAAAYVVVVEGREGFTRPQLMRLVADFIGETSSVSREDGLISFGRLLRDGRIEKTRRGQFSIPSTSHVVAEARKLAG
ncbi:MAG: hypothetical protein Q7J57_13605 [Gemmobacter sp.]|nr:hypothetical protein [Gemmobacter sp.]